jgi:carboxy-cis,cis-muconate cyclase
VLLIAKLILGIGNNANFVTALSKAPYTVFGTPYGSGCPTLAISTDSSGTLETTVANASYLDSSGVHGTALSPKNDFLYSADDMGNAVWVHSYDEATGVIREVQYLAAASGSNPRHLAVHPNGKWVYVVYEEANAIAAYERDTTTGKLEFHNETYSLLPSGDNILYQKKYSSCMTNLWIHRIHQLLFVLG